MGNKIRVAKPIYVSLYLFQTYELEFCWKGGGIPPAYWVKKNLLLYFKYAWMLYGSRNSIKCQLMCTFPNWILVLVHCSLVHFSEIWTGWNILCSHGIVLTWKVSWKNLSFDIMVLEQQTIWISTQLSLSI